MDAQGKGREREGEGGREYNGGEDTASALAFASASVIAASRDRKAFILAFDRRRAASPNLSITPMVTTEDSALEATVGPIRWTAAVALATLRRDASSAAEGADEVHDMFCQFARQGEEDPGDHKDEVCEDWEDEL